MHYHVARLLFIRDDPPSHARDANTAVWASSVGAQRMPTYDSLYCSANNNLVVKHYWSRLSSINVTLQLAKRLRHVP